MKRLAILVLVLVGLTALLSGCGGGEEAGVLAVAFRLDGESPIVTTYIGDPNEDPFQPPAGRYYIEAVDQDDVAISLGAVEVEEGQVVAFPPSFEAVGGVADAERVESLKTVATFLIDFELSELTFIEAITGGFTSEYPFDPSVEPEAAAVQALLDLYAEMADQEEALESALSEVEERAAVSAGTLYVRSPWAPAPDLTDVAKKKLNDWFNSTFSFFRNATVVRQRKRILEIADKIPEDKREQVFNKLSPDKQGDAANFDDWLNKVRTDDDFVRDQGSGIYYELDGLDHQAVVDSGNNAINVIAEEGAKGADYAKDKVLEAYKSVPVVGKLIDTTEKALELEAWAKQFAKDPGAATDKAFRDHLQKQLAERWKEYLKERAVDLPSLSDTAIEKLSEYLAKKVVDRLPKLPSSLTPAATARPSASRAVPTPKATPKVTPSASPAPSPEASPEVIPSPEETAELDDDLGWIDGYVQGIANGWVAEGYTDDVQPYADALRQCLVNAVLDGATREEAIRDCPPELYKPIFEPKETPSPSPSPPPSPSPSPSPTPSPTPSPSPTVQEVTAEGQPVLGSYPGCVVEQNTMTLEWKTDGGPVSGQARLVLSCETDPKCPRISESHITDYQGTYSPDSNTFSGIWEAQINGTTYQFDEDEGCVPEPYSYGVSGEWQATLEDGVVRDSLWPEFGGFELTVQGLAQAGAPSIAVGAMS